MEIIKLFKSYIIWNSFFSNFFSKSKGNRVEEQIIILKKEIWANAKEVLGARQIYAKIKAINAKWHWLINATIIKTNWKILNFNYQAQKSELANDWY